MEYMESKMQEQMESAEARSDDLFKEMDLFCEWTVNAIPDFDETLLKNKVNTFSFENETVELMWIGWKAKCGL